MMNTRPDEIAVTHVSLDTGRVELTKGEVGHGLDAFVIEGLVNEEECGALIKARPPPPHPRFFDEHLDSAVGAIDYVNGSGD